MHKRPESPHQGITLDLAEIEREMRQEEQYRENGQAARTLVHEPDLRVVLMVLRGGTQIPEHDADGTTAVLALTGRLRLRLAGREVELAPGQALVMQRGLKHDVGAADDSAFLLTLGWSASE